MKPAEPVALLDMDGTLVDYDTVMEANLASLRSPDEKHLEKALFEMGDTRPAWYETRVRMIRNQPGWWRNLPKYKPGFEILALLKDLDFKLMVLTKGPASSTASWTEKVEWCNHHVPEIPITITQDKGLVYGKVLCDDWPNFGLRWLEWRPRGLLVVPAHRWNTLDKYPEHLHPNIFRYEGPHQTEALYQALKIVRSKAG